MWFVHDPDQGIITYDTAEEARDAANVLLDFERTHASDCGWSENTGYICWGQVSQMASITSRKVKPPEDQLDEDGCDKDGMSYGDFDEILDYGLVDAV